MYTLRITPHTFKILYLSLAESLKPDFLLMWNRVCVCPLHSCMSRVWLREWAFLFVSWCRKSWIFIVHAWNYFWACCSGSLLAFHAWSTHTNHSRRSLVASCVCAREIKKSGATLGERHVTFHYKSQENWTPAPSASRETHLLVYPRDFCNSIWRKANQALEIVFV